ncbi:MAG TPA: WecB/TagA/CpsF family glycosyltransferase [Rhizomicrobium sp.]|nr:WecB/TagA/CpsF family glycosyltransferase [Rhizomicrobium sp.]
MAQLENRVWIGGVPVTRFTASEWARLMIADWQYKKERGGPPKVVTTANGQVISLFAQDAAYRSAVLAADYIAADGMSVVFASQLATDAPLPERVATTDWFHDAARAASRHGIRFYLLGATPDANARAVSRARRLYPFLQLAGAHDGYFDRDAVADLAEEISASEADILWIGVGNPEQVQLAHVFKELAPGLTWVRTCGGLFDFLSGSHSRAPAAVQAVGMEWAYRVALEPRRLAWRYATTNVQAAYQMATKSQGRSRGGSLH